MKFSITLAVGKWGGIYIRNGWSWGLCLGWVAITFIPADVEELVGHMHLRLKEFEKTALKSASVGGNA